MDVLTAADLCLLPGLKRHCGAFIGQFLEIDNVMEAFQTARMFELNRLEDNCCLFIAENLETVRGIILHFQTCNRFGNPSKIAQLLNNFRVFLYF